jgi:hypothetical protein
MARIRTIKPSFWGDEKVVELSFPARLLLVGLISMADDDGRFIATPQAILGYVYPHDTVTLREFDKWFQEVRQSKIVETYTSETRSYAWFPNWLKHQRINRPQPSSLPPPPGAPLDGDRE